MRIAFLALTLAVSLLAGVASTASAHYVVEQGTPAGTLCALNDEKIAHGIATSDQGEVISGIAQLNCP